MKLRISLLIALLSIAVYSTPALSAPDPSKAWANRVVMKVLQSVVRVTSDNSVCTGFVIDAQKDIVLTAGHCVDAFPVYADGEEAIVILDEDEVVDLAVLQARIRKPALEPALDIEHGEEIVAIGYANGFPVPQMRVGFVLAPFASAIGPLGLGHGYVIMSFPLVGGMSGGPVVNKEGKVVGISQLSSNVDSAARSAIVIMQFLNENYTKIWK